MKQKYCISKKPETKEMRIQEYAIVDNDSYRKDTYLLTDQDFVLLSEQTYTIPDIKDAISKGREDIITELRTDQFFPARLCIEKIADTVIELFALEGDQTIVLIYDDKDGFAEDAVEEADSVATESGKSAP